jgi:GH18 family chitinase
MKKYRFILVVVATLICGCSGSHEIFVTPVNPPRVCAAYFAMVDGAYDKAMSVKNNIPWDKVNRVYIAFATLDDNGLLTNLQVNGSTGEADKRIRTIISQCRSAQPKAEIYIVSNFGGEMNARYLAAAKNPQGFADSVLAYLKSYGLDGFDMDWETYNIDDYAVPLKTILTTTYKTLKASGISPSGGTYKLSHTIWPGVHSPETVASIKDCVDEINLMTYGTGPAYSLEEYAPQYSAAGFPYSKMVAGVESEFGYSDNEGPDTEASVSAKADFVKKNKLAGMFSWRLDNDMCATEGTGDEGPPTFQVAKWVYKYLYLR